MIIHCHLAFPPKVRIRVLGANFRSTPFSSIDAVGPGSLDSGAKRRGVLKKKGLAAGTRIPKNEPVILV